MSKLSTPKYSKCRYCNGLVFANNPICSKCGLEMNSEGIIDLAKIEESKIDAIQELYKLKQISLVYIVFPLLGYLFVYLTEIRLLFHIYFWMVIIMMTLSYRGWNAKYSSVEFESEDVETIKNYKKIILACLGCNLLEGLFIYWFLLK